MPDTVCLPASVAQLREHLPVTPAEAYRRFHWNRLAATGQKWVPAQIALAELPNPAPGI